MKSIIKRTLAKEIIRQKTKFPVLAVTGPRQSGKTTLLKHLFNDYEYVSLENPDIRSYAEEDPRGFLQRYDQNVIFDEVQRVPELFSYIQGKVDESGLMGHYILSGSQNFHLMSNITQSLAGRVALFRLLPLDFSELKSEDLLDHSATNVMLHGFYPALFDRNIEPTVFYSNYLSTYIEKDVTELLNVQNFTTFRRFINLCAGRSGQLLNVSSLANDCDISHTTARSWLSILESSYIIFLLQPYHENFNKRVIKSPKLYFYDTGLLCHLLGIKRVDELDSSRLKGSIFESMIVAEFFKINHHRYEHRNFYFWRDSNQNEVDLLEKTFSGFNAYEIKSTQTITPSLFKGLDYFSSLTKSSVEKTLIYGGTEQQKRTKYSVCSWRDIK